MMCFAPFSSTAINNVENVTAARGSDCRNHSEHVLLSLKISRKAFRAREILVPASPMSRKAGSPTEGLGGSGLLATTGCGGVEAVSGFERHSGRREVPLGSGETQPERSAPGSLRRNAREEVPMSFRGLAECETDSSQPKVACQLRRTS